MAAMADTGTAPATQPGTTAPNRAVPVTASVAAAVNAEPVAPTPSTGPSPATQTFASMLAAAGYDRYSSIKNLEAQIPPHLSADDAALILSGTDNRRQDTIKTPAGPLPGRPPR